MNVFSTSNISYQIYPYKAQSFLVVATENKSMIVHHKIAAVQL